MTQDEIIKSWIPMVEFIARTYGENCEVILHDLRDLDKSIVAIKNNHITGRQIGGTITDFALKLIMKNLGKNVILSLITKGEFLGNQKISVLQPFSLKMKRVKLLRCSV